MEGAKHFSICFFSGRFMEFDADDVESNDEQYIFTIGGDIIAEFGKNMIAGYVITGVNEE